MLTRPTRLPTRVIKTAPVPPGAALHGANCWRAAGASALDPRASSATSISPVQRLENWIRGARPQAGRATIRQGTSAFSLR